MPKLFKNKYRIESTRLKDWDYSHNGYYFITICSKDCKCYFGEVADGEIVLSEVGKIAEKFWLEIPKHFDNIYLDAYTIMPNHLHGIVKIFDDGRRDEALPRLGDRDEAVPRLYNGDHPEMSKISPNAGSLSVIIGSYKSIVSKTIHQQFLKINFNWQPRFYDHIIRNEITLNKIRKYIIDNPFRWHLDRNNPEGLWM